jgi:chitinase
MEPLFCPHRTARMPRLAPGLCAVTLAALLASPLACVGPPATGGDAGEPEQTEGTGGSAGSAGGFGNEIPEATGGRSGGQGGSPGGAGGMARDAAAPRDTGPPPSEPVPAGCGAETIVTSAFLDAIFPPAGRNPVYTHAGFLQAAKAFPRFIATGDAETCRKEAAAFLANVAHESGRLRYVEEINKNRYCSNRGDCPCDNATNDQSKWYFGRGAMQLSWNYNYCAAGNYLGVDLRAQPDLISRTPELAWKTAIWFWMTQVGGGRDTCHNSITGPGGFGETIRTINGGIECNKGGYGAQPGVTERVKAYLDYAKRLGITNPGAATDNDC